MSATSRYYIGIDVGTQSVRAGLVTEEGHIIKSSSQTIKTWNPMPSYYEQSSDDIWNACCSTVKNVTKGISPECIKGIGFDATCSLVILDSEFHPLPVNNDGRLNCNVILWMDHRAMEQTKIINYSKHPVLNQVGGKVSPEMEPPKLLWLKQNLPDIWSRIGYCFDLPDFLTWKATGKLTRSLCSLTCKWLYHVDKTGKHGWNKELYEEIGLGDLLQNNFQKIGHEIKMPGDPCDGGLIHIAATDMHLLEGTAVATSIIDAHAGAIGLLGCSRNEKKEPFSSKMAMICGTSTCHMLVSTEPVFVPGVWGPYFSAVIPGLWTNEAGQSVTGALVDHIIYNHPAFQNLKKIIKEDSNIYEELETIVMNMCKLQKLSSVAYLTNNFHVWPDFHGNRSPLADQSSKGMIYGLTMSAAVDDLGKYYLATIQALAYGTRHIIEALKDKGYKIDVLLMCGGLSSAILYVQTHADAIGLPVVLPNEKQSVILGSAILGARASGDYGSVESAMRSMCGSGRTISPDCTLKDYHDKKYKVFLEMKKFQDRVQNTMEDFKD